MEKRGSKRYNSRGKGRQVSSWFAKVPSLIFAIVGLIFAFISVYFIGGFSHDIYSIIFYSAEQCFNFFLIGQSFRLRTFESRKPMLLGVLVFILDFLLIYFIDNNSDNQFIFAVAGTLVALLTVIGTLLLLKAIKKVISR